MEERGGESSLAEPYPSPSPGGEESPPQEAVACDRPSECDEAEGKGETGCSSVPQGSSSPASQPSGPDAGAPEVAALEHVADAVSAASGDAAEQAAPVDTEEADDSLNPEFEQATENGEAEALVPQGSGAASASCFDGGDEKTIAFAADAGNTAVDDAGLLKEQALSVSMEETENTLIPQSQQENIGGQDEVLMHRGSSAVSPPGSDVSIQEFTVLKSDTVATITGDAAAQEISEMDVDGAPISQWQQGKDSEQEEVLMPQSSSAVFPSDSNDVLKFGTVESDSTAIAVDDHDAVEVAVSNMDVAVDNDAAEVALSKMDADSAPTERIVCGEVDASVSKCSTSSPSSSDRLEKVAACEHDAVATSCDDDDFQGEEAAFADVSNLDSLPLSLSEQMEDNKGPDILVAKCSLSELASDSDRGVQNMSAIEPDTAATSHESADAIDDEPVQMDVEVDDTRAIVRRGGGRRKRGRPAKSQVARTASRRKEEEEVCFICFDGGDLVVCDRRGCPKVYHPSCVNRNEAFFRAKGKWSCGWHICSICERSARYMCFTCTHSLCRGCFKNSGFVCVRGYKGFCETCMTTVVLIEANEHGNETTIGVDFDDRTSFEYLFKDYWLSLKGKLSLTLEELTRAKNPVKKPDVAIGNEESSDDLHTAKEEQVASSDSSSENKEERISSRRNLRKRSRNAVKEEGIVKDVENAGTSVSREFDWASEELLEFVAHMKNGDRSALSQFDVQGLLLEYIKKKNLRDPRRKSQIICDARLQNLFGKERVGHFEMLKLLESHFFTKEVSTLDTEDRQGGVVDPDPDPTDTKGNFDPSTKITLDKKRKARKKVEKELLTNLDDYAAIDVHNISLMYLRRNLMEELIDDVSSLDETVIGSFVRIRISGVGQRQDMYRLVQVVGTSKATERYKSGKKTTDVTLEILNLNKKETITIDIISNQDFTEEECKRLRQSIKCGLIGRLTVGDVQEKARSLQAVRVNDWLESEKLRLGHLRDRASEKGRRKELRECVEKLQLLNTPEERQRRLHEIPEIHADPHMDPDYESAEEEEESDLRKKDYYNRSRGASFPRGGREVKSPGKGGSALSDSWVSSRKNSNSWESNRTSEGASIAESSAGRGVDANEFSLSQANDIRQINGPETPRNHVLSSVSDASQHGEKQHKARAEQSSDGALQVVSNTSESDKTWHYKDPAGKIQGPFSMTQLRKWSTTGYFPPNLKIWRTSEKQDDSILLTDALAGKFEKDLPEWVPPCKTTPQSMVVSPTALSAEKSSGVWRGSNESASSNSKQNAQNWSVGQNEKWASSGERISPKEVDVRFAQEQGTNTALVSHPGGQYHGNLSPNSISHRLSSSMMKVPPVNDSSYQWRNDSSTMPTPTQPVSKGWSSEEGSSDKAMEDTNSGWINTTRGKEEADSSFSVDEPTRAASNSFRELGSRSARYMLDQTVTSDRGKSQPVSSLSAADSVSLGQSMASTQHQNKIDAMSNFQIRNYQLDSSSNVENQRSLILPRKDETNQQSNQSFETKMILTQEQAAACRLEDNQNDPCLSHNQHNPERSVLQLDSNVLSENPRERTTVSEMEILTSVVSSKFVQADLERNPAGLAGSLDKNIYQTPAVAYPGYNFVPERVSSEAPNLGISSGDAASNLFVQPAGSESSSAQRSQTPRAPNPEPCVTGSEPMHSNFEVMHMKSNNNPNQPAQQLTPYGWNSIPGSNSVNSESVKLLSSDNTKPPFPSQFGGNASIAPVQQTHLGFGSGPNMQNTSFSVALQNPSPNSGPVQGTGNMSWIPAPQGNMNAGWGMVSQGNMSMSWGQPAQTIGNMNMGGLGAPNQVNMMNSGWVTPAPSPVQGNANVNVGWVTPAMANTNQTPGWGGQLQGNFPVNPVWAMLLQGQTNPGPGPGPGPAPSPGWVAPVPPNAHQNWETPNQGNMNMNAAWGSGQGNVNLPMNPSAGNPQSLSSQPPPNGDRHSSQSDNAWVNDSGQSNRRPSWNRVPPGGSAAPPRGQTGICKFHESGHCKKGASCNYFHP